MASSEEDVRNKQIRKLISLRNRVSQRRPFRSQVDGTQEFRRGAVIGFEIPVTRARVWNKVEKHLDINNDHKKLVLRQCSRCICRSRALAEASREKPQVYPMQASSHWLTWSTLVSATVSFRNYTKDYIISLTACAHVDPPEWSSRWDTVVFTFLRLFSASWLAGLHYILQKNIWEESAVANNFVSPKPELVELFFSNFQARRRALWCLVFRRTFRSRLQDRMQTKHPTGLRTAFIQSNYAYWPDNKLCLFPRPINMRALGICLLALDWLILELTSLLCRTLWESASVFLLCTLWVLISDTLKRHLELFVANRKTAARTLPFFLKESFLIILIERAIFRLHLLQRFERSTVLSPILREQNHSPAPQLGTPLWIWGRFIACWRHDNLAPPDRHFLLPMKQNVQ